MPAFNATPWWYPPMPSTSEGGSHQSSTNVSSQQSTQDSSGSGFSQSYIPEYSQTPILESIAKQAQAMAPEVYQWGMEQYNKNQGNIDAMMRNAMTYASPQRIAASMGSAQAGVAQGAAAGLENAKKDLQSFGIDPSSGRYAALDKASQVVSGAQAAGAGNIQRDRDIATGFGMQSTAQGLSGQNYQTGYGAAGAANALLSTASQLKYPPLGTMAANVSTSTGQSSGTSTGTSESSSANKSTGAHGGGAAGGGVTGGQRPMIGQNDAGGGEQPTTGGFVSTELSPSSGSQVDDVQARLNAGEFVIPKDVSAWLGQEYFYKLMAKARANRATAGQENGEGGMGYAGGGDESQPMTPMDGGGFDSSQLGYGAR